MVFVKLDLGMFSDMTLVLVCLVELLTWTKLHSIPQNNLHLLKHSCYYDSLYFIHTFPSVFMYVLSVGLS